jgi:lipid-binding SYLF domain-containing protein
VGAGAAAAITSDMVSFARSKGVFAGVSFDGAVISPDDPANEAFYGRPVTPVDILVRGSERNAAAAPLVPTLTQNAR